MSSISGIALTGMSAALNSLNSAANNIANVNTTGFRRQEVLQTELAAGGVSTSLTESSVAGSSVETDMVTLLQAKNSFLANLAVFKTGNQNAGTLLDEVS